MRTINNDIRFGTDAYKANMSSTAGYNEALSDVYALIQKKVKATITLENQSTAFVIAAIYKELAEEIMNLS